MEIRHVGVRLGWRFSFDEAIIVFGSAHYKRQSVTLAARRARQLLDTGRASFRIGLGQGRPDGHFSTNLLGAYGEKDDVVMIGAQLVLDAASICPVD
jgi:hypothetical protein